MGVWPYPNAIGDRLGPHNTTALHMFVHYIKIESIMVVVVLSSSPTSLKKVEIKIEVRKI